MNQNTGVNFSKLLGLEIIRFICAFAVLIYHYKHFAYIGLESNDVEIGSLPFYGLFLIFYKFGFYGVHIFWCISGFIFFWKYADAVAERRIGSRTFFLLRFSRLYPLHALTLLIVTGLQFVYLSQYHHFFVYPNNDVWHFVLQIFLATDWTTQTVGSFNGPIWSISVEVLVYFLFFCSLRTLKSSPLVNIAIIGACLAAKAIGTTNSIIDCLAFFYAGGLGAFTYRKAYASPNKSKIDCALIAALGMVCGLILVTKIYWNPAFPYFFLLFTIPAILYLAARPIPLGARMEKVISAAGNMTYSSYLMHFPLQLISAIVFSRLGIAIPYHRAELFTAYITGTLIVAYLIFEYFEMPAQKKLRAISAAIPLRPAVKNS